MLPRRCMLIAAAVATIWVVAETAQARRVNVTDVHPTRVTQAETVLPEPVVADPQPHCCPPPHIKYRHCGPKLCCGPCKPGKSIVLTVKHPCRCCAVDVPICLPACCEGEPTVCAGKGFLCRDTVEYEWCCGFYVRVAFKHCGGLVVTTWGR